MFIMEGPDNSGKSTLIEQLGSTYSLNTLKKAVNSDRSAAFEPENYLDVTLRYETTSEPWLLDRFFLISGSIYGPILSMNGRVSHPNRVMEDPQKLQYWWQRFDAEHQQGRIFIVWCLPPYNVVRDRASNDPHMDGSLFVNLARIYWSYHMLAYRNQSVFPAHSFVYDGTKEGIDEEFIPWFEKALDSHREGDFRV